MSFDHWANRALIGAALGGSLVYLFVLLVFESRFVFEALLALGSGGTIGGALCGIVLGAPNKRAGVIIGGLFGGIAGCILATIGILFYAKIPWPSPQPYPGVETQMTSGVGSWGLARTQAYTTTLSLGVMEQYYQGQMNQYCVDDWHFENLSDTKYELCHQADCRVPRLGLEQYFRVEVCSVSEAQTVITHVDMWQD